MATPSPGVFNGLGGLQAKWDASARLRKRLREVGQLVVAEPAAGAAEAPGPLAKTNANLRYNQEALIGLVEIMHGVFDKVPCIDALTEQLAEMFRANGLGPPGPGALSEQAWALRYLFGVLKQHKYKPVCTRDSCKQVLCINEFPRTQRSAFC